MPASVGSDTVSRKQCSHHAPRDEMWALGKKTIQSRLVYAWILGLVGQGRSE
jgi:hypothetical protein